MFTNQGGFALNASFGSAKKVFGVDISSSAIEMAENNSNLNSFQNIEFTCEDVFEFLKKQIDKNNKYDIIICDPPAFAKNKKSVPNALIAYRRVNKLAMRCLNYNGMLLTSSCSQHVDEYSFFKQILLAAKEGNKQITQFYRGQQSPDHPIVPAMPETNYLKFFGFTVK